MHFFFLQCLEYYQKNELAKVIADTILINGQFNAQSEG